MKRLLAFLLLFISIYSNSQTVAVNNLDSLSGAIVTKIRNADKEQLQIVTDKSIYIAGENVWFRAFLLHTSSGKINSQSKRIFVEIVNEKNTVIDLVILQTNPEELNGKFFLPKTLKSGYYWLRAFTEGMRLNNSTNYLEQPVYVYNQDEKDVAKNKKDNEPILDEMPEVLFYPEGGNVMTGAASVVALSITDKNKKPIHIDGLIKDSRDSIIANFTTNEFGLAKFQYEPLKFRRYNAIIILNGKQYIYSLPPFNPFAVQMAITQQKDNTRKVRILLEDSIYNSNYQTYLIAKSRGNLCFASIGNGNYEVTVPDNKFPSGIATFFLFDKNIKLLSERNIYINENVIANAEMNKNVYSKRDKAVINFSFTNPENVPVITSFSVSVTGERFIKFLNDAEADINNWSLSGNKLSDEETDLLMLTKNNEYKNVMSQKSFDVHENHDDSLFYISGYLKDKNDKPLPGNMVSIYSKTGDNFFITDTTDLKGRFNFKLTGYPDSTLFTLQLHSNSGKSGNWQIELDTFRFPKPNITSMAKRKFKLQLSDTKSYIDPSFFEPEQVTLPVVKVSDNSVKDPSYNVAKRVSTFSHVILGKDIPLTGGESIGNAVMAGTGLKLLNGYLVFGGPTTFSGLNAGSEPLVIVDGISVTPPEPGNGGSPDLSYLNTFDARHIEFIEVLTGPDGAAYGLRGGNGVIIVNTSTNDRDINSRDGLSKSFYAKGYSSTPFFAMPVYETKKQIQDAVKDLRSTVYWNGNIITDKNGKATISFYTNDVAGNYIITINGITNNGDAIHKTFSITVK